VKREPDRTESEDQGIIGPKPKVLVQDDEQNDKNPDKILHEAVFIKVVESKH